MTPDADFEGNVTVDVAATIAIDAASNPNTAATQSVQAVDTKAPTVTVSGTNTLKQNETSTLTFTFSEAPTGFTVADITAVNGTLSSFGGSGTSYTVVFTPTEDFEGTGSVTVGTGYTDSAGNTGTASASYNIAIDAKAPSVVITDDEAGTGNIAGGDITYTFTFSEAVTGFTVSDVTVIGGTKGTFTAVSATVYTLVVTPDVDFEGNITVDVAASVAIDAASNLNTAATQSVQAVDTKAPTVTVTGTNTLKQNETSTLTFTFSEAPTGFTQSDITPVNGTLSGFSGSGTSYTVVFTPTDDFEGTGSVAVGTSYTDTAGNTGTASATYSITIDTKASTVTISGTNTLKQSETSTLTFTFSEAPTGFTQSDITPVNGTLSSFSGSGTSYMVVFTPTDNFEGTGSVTVGAGYTDAAGNTGTASATYSIAIDTTAPTVTVSGTNTLKQNETSTLTFTFSEAPTGFTVADITAVNGTLTSFSGAGTSYTVVFTPTDNFEGSGSVTVGTGYTDTAGNIGIASATYSLAIDTEAPTVLISGLSTLKKNETSTLTFTFSEAPTGFTVADITPVNGTLSSFSGSGTSYTVVFTPTDNFEGSGSVMAGTGYTDAAGNTGTASAAYSITIDTKAPTVLISGVSTLKKNETTTLTFAFSEAQTGFTVADVTPVDGTLSGFSGSGTSYTVVFTPTDDFDGSGSVTVGTGYTDAAGNTGTASAAYSITIDTKAPTVLISGVSTLKKNETTTLTFAFSEAPTGFTVADISPVNGTLSSFSGSGTSYTVVFTPTNNFEGSGSVVVGTGYMDAAGNTGTASAAYSLTIDTKAPTVLISGASTLKKNETTSLTFTFSEAPTGFTVADITPVNGTLSSFSGFGTSYTVIFTPTDDFEGSGSVTVGTGYTDAAGNTGTASAAYSLTIDTKAPTVLIGGTNTLKKNETTILTFTFSEAPTGFTMADITPVNGTLSSFGGSSTSYTVVFTPTDNFEGSGSVTVGTGYTDTAGNTGTASAAYSLAIDTTDPTFDFGDAPDTGEDTGTGNYQTLAANGGPSHDISQTQTTLYLGTGVDGEADASVNARANGDDLGTGATQTGVIQPGTDLQWTTGTIPTIRLRATNNTGTPATLYGWIDYNQNGVFDNSTEHASVTVPAGSLGSTFTLAFPEAPSDAATGTTYARFRLSSDTAAANSTGPAVGGEIEDYTATILHPTNGTVDSSKTVKIASSTNGGPPLANSDFFGETLASLGDLDGDGVTDLAVGAYRNDNSGENTGAVYVQFMNPNGTVKSYTKIASGINGGPVVAVGDAFGRSIASLGDLDGDGVTDLAVGAFLDDTGGTDCGAIYVLFMNSDGTAKDYVKIANNLNGGPSLTNINQFGWALTSMGDLDGDGVNDLAVGSPVDNTGGQYRGAVHVLLMNANGTAKSTVKIASNINGAPSLANSDYFGFSVASLGDMDGDGVSDLAVAAIGDDTGGSRRGAVHVLFMNPSGTVKSTKKIADGLNGGPALSDVDVFGYALTALGDIDGDGVTDLAVGALGDDTGGTYRGAVHVLLLNADSSVKSSLKIASNTNGGPTLSNNDYFGIALASLGDLNGDGVTELAVGGSG